MLPSSVNSLSFQFSCMKNFMAKVIRSYNYKQSPLCVHFSMEVSYALILSSTMSMNSNFSAAWEKASFCKDWRRSCEKFFNLEKVQCEQRKSEFFFQAWTNLGNLITPYQVNFNPHLLQCLPKNWNPVHFIALYWPDF